MDDQQRARELEIVAERNLRSYVIRHVPAGPDRVSALLCIDTLAALLAAPEGFVLVPVEPTEEMLIAAKRFQCAHSENEDWMEWEGLAAANQYRAMLAARPQGVK